MVRVTRAEVCSHDEIAVVHVMSRVVWRCVLFGTDDHTGNCYNHRRASMETELKRLATCFGIDLHVDLSTFRAAMAETLEASYYTSIKKRIESLQQEAAKQVPTRESDASPDRFLTPMQIDECQDPHGPRPSRTKRRASDKGFLPISRAAYVELLDWTAKQVAPGKRGCTPQSVPPIFERLDISRETWCSLVGAFGRLFHHVVGKPHVVASARGKLRRRRFRISPEAQAIFESSADPPIA